MDEDSLEGLVMQGSLSRSAVRAPWHISI